MGIKDTNAATAYDGILRPIEDDEPLDTPVREAPAPGADFAPKVREKKAVKPIAPNTDSLFRPRQRPAFPQLQVLDDSQRSAETIRIRKSPFRIGRLEGDLVIPLDSQLSANHVEIFLQAVNGNLQWHLRDLGSRNGTFVRVNEMLLKPDRTLLIGAVRFRFEAGTAPSSVGALAVERTQLPSAKDSKSDSTAPCLILLDHESDENRIPLSQQDQWIGHDRNLCSIVVDDPTVSAKHVRIYCDKKGRWYAQCPEAINGLWTQVDEVALDRSSSFQCGEQRFHFRLV